MAYRNETQIVVTVMGSDQENPYDVLAINGASASLMTSGIPFDGPIGAVRVAYTRDGTWIPHPTFDEIEEATFELIVAGRAITPDQDILGRDDIAIMMVEAGGTEQAWSHYEAGAPKVTEEVIADGLEQSKGWIRESIDLQLELIEKVRAQGEITPLSYVPQLDYADNVYARVEAVGSEPVAAAGAIAAKAERNAATEAAVAEIVEQLAAEFEGREKEIKAAARSLQKELIRRRVVNEGLRIDGRGAKDLRPVSAEVGVVARCARLRTVPTGRDPGAQRGHPRHAEDGPAARQPGQQATQALHAPLQHAAPRQRRDRPRRQPQAP